MRGPKNTSKVRVTKRPFWCEPSAPSRATLARFRTCAPLHLNRTTSASVPRGKSLRSSKAAVARLGSKVAREYQRQFRQNWP